MSCLVANNLTTAPSIFCTCCAIWNLFLYSFYLGHLKSTDDAFHQQKLRMWQPILSPLHVIIIFMSIGIAFVPTGIYLSNLNNTLYEDSMTYDGGDNDLSAACGITQQNEGKPCSFMTFTLSKDVEEDIHVYYELENFYQNHRLYVQSYDNKQLLGKHVDALDLQNSCMVRITNGTGHVYNPCGLIAHSYFNDVITFEYVDSEHPYNMDETNIAWPSDFDKFQQPEGFQYAPVANAAVSCGDAGLPSGCKTWMDPDGSQWYKYYYPNDHEVDYIHEVYPQINPLKGVTDEHFMVWFRTAARPIFRKLYGRIQGPFTKGQVLKFSVDCNFEVASFGGTKTLVISTLTSMGGSNTYLGTAFIAVGILSFLLTILFVVKQMVSERRKMGDASLLRWDD